MMARHDLPRFWNVAMASVPNGSWHNFGTPGAVLLSKTRDLQVLDMPENGQKSATGRDSSAWQLSVAPMMDWI